jgi:hypothetical protein
MQTAHDNASVSKTTVKILHHSARPHVANTIKTTVQRMRCEVLELPAYSPKLSPCDFHILGPLKQALKGR